MCRIWNGSRIRRKRRIKTPEMKMYLSKRNASMMGSSLKIDGWSRVMNLISWHVC